MLGLMKALVESLSVNAQGAQKSLRLTQRGSLAVSDVEEYGTDLALSGLRFAAGPANGEGGNAPVVAVPTTAAAFVLWNGEDQGSGLHYIMDLAGVVLISGTPAVGGSLLLALTTDPIAKPTADAGYAVTSLNRGSRQSKAVIATGVTLAAAPVWTPHSANGNAVTGVGGGAFAELSGRIAIPPQFGLAMTYFSGAGTSPLFGAAFRWSEISGDRR